MKTAYKILIRKPAGEKNHLTDLGIDGRFYYLDVYEI
jgi:hypothetical protein